MLNYLREHGRITNRELREMSGISRMTAHRDLTGPVDAGPLKAVGAGRGAH